MSDDDNDDDDDSSVSVSLRNSDRLHFQHHSHANSTLNLLNPVINDNEDGCGCEYGYDMISN